MPMITPPARDERYGAITRAVTFLSPQRLAQYSRELMWRGARQRRSCEAAEGIQRGARRAMQCRTHALMSRDARFACYFTPSHASGACAGDSVKSCNICRFTPRMRRLRDATPRAASHRQPDAQSIAYAACAKSDGAMRG